MHFWMHSSWSTFSQSTSVLFSLFGTYYNYIITSSLFFVSHISIFLKNFSTEFFSLHYSPGVLLFSQRIDSYFWIFHASKQSYILSFSADHVNDTRNFFQDYHNQIVLAFIWFLDPALSLYDFKRIFIVSLLSIEWVLKSYY